jgi:hypothetical protein
MKKAQLITYFGERVVNIKKVYIPVEYDGNPYGDTVPFSVGSNQRLITDEADFIKRYPINDNEDAAKVEQWLLNNLYTCPDIINTFALFQKQHGWDEKRCNAAFHHVFTYSLLVTW